VGVGVGNWRAKSNGLGVGMEVKGGGGRLRVALWERGEELGWKGVKIFTLIRR